MKDFQCRRQIIYDNESEFIQIKRKFKLSESQSEISIKFFRLNWGTVIVIKDGENISEFGIDTVEFEAIKQFLNE